jgi:ketosteroid isomerase-like protein
VGGGPHRDISMKTRNPIDVFAMFVERINRHDVDGLCELMTEDHLFFDSLGNQVRGRDEMKTSWRGYFELFPDYEISCESTSQQGDVVIAVGTAGATYSPDGVIKEQNRWRVPAAWKAVMASELVAEWRVYADNDPVRRIIEREQPESEE